MAITTIEAVAEWLNRSATDPAVVTAFDAAHSYVLTRVDVPDDVPAELVLAVCYQTARYLERRNSPDGTIGVNEFGVVRVGTGDRDVATMIAPWRKVVLA